MKWMLNQNLDICSAWNSILVVYAILYIPFQTYENIEKSLT